MHCIQDIQDMYGIQLTEQCMSAICQACKLKVHWFSDVKCDIIFRFLCNCITRNNRVMVQCSIKLYSGTPLKSIFYNLLLSFSSISSHIECQYLYTKLSETTCCNVLGAICLTVKCDKFNALLINKCFTMIKNF